MRFDVDTRLSHTEDSVSTMRLFPTRESLDEAMEKARIIDAINHWYNTLSVTPLDCIDLSTLQAIEASLFLVNPSADEGGT